MKRFLIFILLIPVILVGCGKTDINRIQSSTEVKQTVSQESAIPFQAHQTSQAENQNKVNEPWGIIYSDKTQKVDFLIKPKLEDNFYHADDMVYNAFICSLFWASDYKPQIDDGISPDEYDYILKTNYSDDIYIDSGTGIFRFGSEKRYYKLWSGKNTFWSCLKFDRNNFSVTLTVEELVFDGSIIKEDVNGDGIPENINLRTSAKLSDYINPALYLVINGHSQLIFEDAFPGLRGEPQIHILNSADSKLKAVVADSSFKSADWGDFGDFYPYIYENGKIQRVKLDRPKQRVKIQDKRVQVEYPGFNQKIDFIVEDESIKYAGGTVGEIFKPNEPLCLREVFFEESEKGVVGLVTVEKAELFKGGYFYTVRTKYTFKDGRLEPESVEFTEN